MKMRLLFLKYILEQPEESKVRRMLKLQVDKPSPGDWAGTCLNDIKTLKLKLSLAEYLQPYNNFLTIVSSVLDSKIYVP